MPTRLTRGKALVGALSIDAQDITISDDLVVGDTANIAGNVAVNTNKFTVNATTGDVVAAGSVTGTGFVMSPKVALVADPTGGATQDAEARTAINAVIDALIAVGIMSPT